MQLSGGKLPDDLPGPGDAADQRRHHNQQRQSEHIVPAQLHDTAGQLSDNLWNNLTVAVIED
jgi:hypothetical protein